MTRFFRTRPALVAYLTCGFPDLATTRAVALAALDAGAEALELGVPFSDPVADGPIIQRASHQALCQGTSLADVLRLAHDLRLQRPQCRLVLFSYLNPVLHFGLGQFSLAARAAGLDGALITDLTVEEAGDYLQLMRAQSLATVFLAAPTSTDARLRRIAGACSGFIYAVSRTGITGTQQQLAADAAQLVRRLRRFTRLPIAVGFGISNPEQFAAAVKFADAVVVGSALVQLIEANPTPAGASQAVSGFIRSLKAAEAVTRTGGLNPMPH